MGVTIQHPIVAIFEIIRIKYCENLQYKHYAINGDYAFILAPSCILAKQIANKFNIPCFIKENNYNREAICQEIEANRVFVMSYEYALCLKALDIFQIIKSRGHNIFAFVDEIHTAYTQHQLRKDVFEFITDNNTNNGLQALVQKVVFLTGTPLPMFEETLDAPIFFANCIQKLKLNTHVCAFNHKKKNAKKAALIAEILDSKAKLTVVSINNSSLLKQVKQMLINSGHFTDNQIACIHSQNDKFDKMDPVSKDVWNAIGKEQLISDNIKVILTTCIFDVGINIANTDVAAIALHDGRFGFQTDKIVQFVSRFRNVQFLDFKYIISKNNAEKEGIDYEAIGKKVSNAFNHFCQQGKKDAKLLSPQNVTEFQDRKKGIFNFDMKFKFDSQNNCWEYNKFDAAIRASEMENKSLTIETFKHKISVEYDLLNTFEIQDAKSMKVYYDSSAKNTQTLQAVERISEWLKDAIYRRYLYAMVVEDDSNVLTKIQKIDPIFTFSYYQSVIKSDKGYQEFKSAFGLILSQGCLSVRVHQFLDYMLLVGSVDLCSTWIQTYSDTTKFRDHYNRVHSAYFKYLEDRNLLGQYAQDGIRQYERNLENGIYRIASEYIDQEMVSSELSKLVHSRLNNGEISVRQVSILLRCGFHIKFDELVQKVA